MNYLVHSRDTHRVCFNTGAKGGRSTEGRGGSMGRRGPKSRGGALERDGATSGASVLMGGGQKAEDD